jgi:hypothetical protein
MDETEGANRELTYGERLLGLAEEDGEVADLLLRGRYGKALQLARGPGVDVCHHRFCATEDDLTESDRQRLAAWRGRRLHRVAVALFDALRDLTGPALVLVSFVRPARLIRFLRSLAECLPD